MTMSETCRRIELKARTLFGKKRAEPVIPVPCEGHTHEACVHVLDLLERWKEEREK